MCKIVFLLLCNTVALIMGTSENVSGRSLIGITGLQEPGPSDPDISVLVEQQERQIRTAVLLALIPVVVAFSFIVFIFYRKKREAFFKQTEAELNLRIAQVEIKALRAQINPHFIFNCLNSIHHYMHKKNITLAGEYLVKFSQLIRYVLETSSLRMVPLRDDLEALKIYMELEQLRMDGSFGFTVDVHDIPQPESLSIPPMMIQPFVENSIWHGLNHIRSGGTITISVRKTGEMIRCVIEDNGKNVTPPEEVSVYSSIKKTSLGVSLIRERLDVVSRIFHVKADFKMEDRLNDAEPTDGKRVILVLPFEE